MFNLFCSFISAKSLFNFLSLDQNSFWSSLSFSAIFNHASSIYFAEISRLRYLFLCFLSSVVFFVCLFFFFSQFFFFFFFFFLFVFLLQPIFFFFFFPFQNFYHLQVFFEKQLSIEVWLFGKWLSVDFCEYFFMSFQYLNFRWKYF